MIDNYKIKIDNNNEEVLFLYINYNYEFANFESKKKNIIKNIKDYIIEHKINFNGSKIKLVVSGIVLCTLILTRNDLINYKNNNLSYSYVSNIIFDSDYKLNNNEKQSEDTNFVDVQNIDDIVETVYVQEEEKINNNQFVNNSNNSDSIKLESNNNNKTPPEYNNVQDSNISNNVHEGSENSKMITIYRTSGDILEISLNDYLVGVVAAEMPASFNKEALITQAIISRTYTLKLLEQNKLLTDDSRTQNYKSIDELKIYWGNDFNKYYTKIVDAVNISQGIVITYNDKLIDAVFHSTSNGYTEDAINVWGYDIPYLKQVDSSFDIYSTPYYRETYYSYEQLNNILGMNINFNTNIVINKNNSNRVSVIYLDGIAFTGINFRNLLGLRSADFDILKDERGALIKTRGYGHGVGLSQYGTNCLAQQGYNYEQIIKYYYKGVTLNKI